jgi:hypothetical protein
MIEAPGSSWRDFFALIVAGIPIVFSLKFWHRFCFAVCVLRSKRAMDYHLLFVINPLFS